MNEERVVEMAERASTRKEGKPPQSVTDMDQGDPRNADAVAGECYIPLPMQDESFVQ